MHIHIFGRIFTTLLSLLIQYYSIRRTTRKVSVIGSSWIMTSPVTCTMSYRVAGNFGGAKFREKSQ